MSFSRVLRATFRTPGLLLLAAGLSLLGANRAEAAAFDSGLTSKLGGKMGLPTMPTFEKIDVTADKMGVDRQTNLATLDGNVRVRFSDVTMTCDSARYDTESGEIHAEGNVLIVSTSGGRWSGDSITFNHKTGEGLVGAGILRLGAFTVQANEDIARDEDGILHAQNATLTTCTNEPSALHWSVTGDGRYKDKEFIELRNAVARLGGVPVLWYPYFYRDLNTDYGWRFMPGYTGKWGAYLKTGYVYPIVGNATEDDAYLYGKNVLDLRSKYGVGIGQELTWGSQDGIFGDGSSQWGRLSLYYANHHDDRTEKDYNWSSPYTENRWAIGLSERITFTPRDTFTLTGEATSDSRFRTDYRELAVRASAQPLGIANYEHRENTWVSALTVAGPLNSFYAGVRRLPEWSLDILPQQAFGVSKLYYESQSTVGYLDRQPVKYEGASWPYRYQYGNWAYYDTLRLDTRHVFRRPITLANGITLTPRAGWRGTYYSDSDDGSSTFRSLFEFGATLQTRYWRDFETVRHTVTPYLDFTFVPGSQMSIGDVPYAFDRRDQEYEWRDRYRSDGLTPTHRYTGLRFGTQQLIQRKTKTGLSDLLDLDLYGVYVFQTQDNYVRWRHRDQIRRGERQARYTGKTTRVKEKTGLRVLGLSGSYAISRHLNLSTDFQFDPENSRLAFWDLHLRYSTEKLTFYAGYLRRNHDIYDYYWTDKIKNHIVYGGFIHRLTDIWEWSLYSRYNLYAGHLEEIGGFLQYNMDCISWRFNAGYLPSYTTEDRVRHENDVRFSVGAWLRAFSHEENSDWLDWSPLPDVEELNGTEPDTDTNPPTSL